ncbi:MAG: 16S rRNA (guanine(966)-N(2))-methyltransferase RsmD [Firmicutes bacterium]|nr:16S rRNA (guanine(966)-N(2))-methyltransferase RsmD [Bacillota bacterium]
MRVIAGKAKGRNLIAPEGMDTRPITDAIKEALFSMWHFDIPGSRFLDLFSGSGSIGIEAISRGAEKAVFVENSRKAVAVINQNLTNCRFQPQAKVYQDDVFAVIKRLDASGEQFDLIFLDPPFTVDEIFHPVIEAVGDTEILAEDGMLGIRTRKEKDMPDEVGCLVKYKEKTYGISTIHFYERKSEENEE